MLPLLLMMQQTGSHSSLEEHPKPLKKQKSLLLLRNLLGRSRFEELLAAYIEKPQGKPTLVPESDKRLAMNTAKNDFTEEYDNE